VAIEPQIRLARLLVGAVTAEAAGHEKRANITVEIDRLCRV
jgi:hypothetical protein